MKCTHDLLGVLFFLLTVILSMSQEISKNRVGEIMGTEKFWVSYIDFLPSTSPRYVTSCDVLWLCSSNPPSILSDVLFEWDLKKLLFNCFIMYISIASPFSNLFLLIIVKKIGRRNCKFLLTLNEEFIRNTRIMCEIERRLSCRSEVWIINLKQILHRVLLFLFLTLSTYLFAVYRLSNWNCSQC